MDTLLQVPVPSERGGVGMPTEDGYHVFDLDLLSQRLHAAMSQALNSSNLNGPSATEQELLAACQFALQHATNCNAWMQCAAAQLKAVQAWRLLAELAVAQRWVISVHQCASCSPQVALTHWYSQGHSQPPLAVFMR